MQHSQSIGMKPMYGNNSGKMWGTTLVLRLGKSPKSNSGSSSMRIMFRLRSKPRKILFAGTDGKLLKFRDIFKISTARKEKEMGFNAV